jgi:4-amino-4-deoxy-L-arabinose transferase-like glycosyltransferase
MEPQEADLRVLQNGDGAKRGAARFLAPACLVLVLIVHFFLLMGRFAPAIATPDANGYWAQGSRLFTTGRTWFVPEADTQYIGMHWLVTDDGRYFSRYPPGLGIVAGLVYAVFGFKASLLVNPVLASLSLVGLYLLVKRLLGAWWAVAAVVVLAINPVFNEQAICCFAHMAVTAPLVWGLYFLVCWSQRGRLWQIFVAGVILGCIPTVRYPEAVFAIGVAVFVLWHARERRRLWLHAALGAAGAAIPIVPLLVRNQLAFGAFYRTGYSLTNEQTGFGWDYFQQHFVGYIRGLNSDGVGLFFALGAIGIVMMCTVRRWRRMGVLLVLLVVPTTLLYMAYYWGDTGMGGTMTLRFLLPTFVCYVVAGVWLLAHITRASSSALKIAAVAVVLVLQFIWGGLAASAGGQQLRYEKQILARVTDALEERIEHGDVVIASEPLLQHLDFVRHWRLVDPMALRMAGGPARSMPGVAEEDSDEPMPMQREKLTARLDKYSTMSRAERAHTLALDVQKWAGEHKVYFVGSEDELARMGRGPLSEGAFKVVERIELPERPQLRLRAGGPGLPGPPGATADRRGGPPGPAGRDRLGPGDGGPPGGFGPGPGQGPGPMGPGAFIQGGSEVVIAEWTARPPARPDVGGGGLASD